MTDETQDRKAEPIFTAEDGRKYRIVQVCIGCTEVEMSSEWGDGTGTETRYWTERVPIYGQKLEEIAER